MALILPDVNVLVYAFHRDAPAHDVYGRWLAGRVVGEDELALADLSLTGFLRVVTNRRIFSDPAPMAEAPAFVGALRTAPRARALSPTKAAWDRFGLLAGSDARIRANLVPDAWLAALALAHGCQLASADRDLARFEGLDWFDPGRG